MGPHLAPHVLRVMRRSHYLLLLAALAVLLVAYLFWDRDLIGPATFGIILSGACYSLVTLSTLGFGVSSR
jgi:hypothetical protein